jgi:aryl-alcohol dehydrogenase-like predicted oxidoreductase
MKKVRLGDTGIEVSRLGIGTGTWHPLGQCAQALMDEDELAGLLIFALEQGVNFWDTAFQYGTYTHIKKALKQVRRSEVVLTTKFITSAEKDTIRDFEYSLKALDTDYLDVCLLHAVRTGREFKKRFGALDAMLRLKEQGKVRAVGFSSHGLSGLIYGLELSEIDVVWARMNHAGLNMDASDLGLYDRLASFPWVKEAVSKYLPVRIRSLFRPAVQSSHIKPEDMNVVSDALASYHSRSKGVVGMKVLAEGALRDDAKKAVEYVMGLNFLDAFIIGMLSKEEISENCRIAS